MADRLNSKQVRKLHLELSDGETLTLDGEGFYTIRKNYVTEGGRVTASWIVHEVRLLTNKTKH